MGRRGYPPELRRAALDAVASGRSVYQVAQELGISIQVIYIWRKQSTATPDDRSSPAPVAPDERPDGR